MFASIRTKLITILLILGVLPNLVVGFFAYETASDALLFQARQQVGNIGEKTAQQIDAFFKELKKDINLLSEYPFIQLAFLQFEFGQKLDTIQNVLTDYRDKNDYFNAIYLADLTGDSIVSDKYSARNRRDFPDRNWLKSRMDKGLVLSDITFSGPEGTPKILLTAPVHDFEDRNRQVGLLVFDIRLSSFTRYVSSLKIGEGGYGFLWDHNGFAVYHPDVGYVFNKNIGEKGDRAFRLLLDKMREGENGFGSYFLDGAQKNMFFTPCKTKQWSVGIVLETSKIMSDILKLRRSMISFTSLICVLILFVSFFFVRSIIRPVSRLMEGARAIGKGNLEHVITIDSGDEFVRLAEEFNNMSSTLRNSMNEIIELKTFNDDILRSVSSGIITVDRNNCITSCNEVAGTLLHLDTDHLDSLATPQLNNIKSVLQSTLSNNRPALNVEIELDGDNGRRPRFMELNTSLLRNNSGEIIGAIADIRDISRRKEIEVEMIRVEKLASLGELSAGMAHEIRNPLAGMKTSAQVLTKRLNRESSKILVDGIIASIDRMNETVTNLLNFSRPKAPCPAPSDLPELIDLSLLMLRINLKKSNIELRLDYGESVPLAMIDKEQIKQVCINLILNAVKAMPRGGVLSISVRGCRQLTQDYVEVSFTDTGTGIKKEHMSKIFDPFFTCDPKGTGLGLSIVQKLLEENNGYIQIDSRVGRGTRATVMLPVA
ncbi:PAS domain-containing sensor histidine kinase [Desulforhopalus singaporensis]|uniref:histidine kinase n=1 Tax=Desulforhopalus singaporensis TaxID=91360 RepID=A0A1H0QDA7_9BACT|nr:PAS domain-containing sensor histidine kinase [Desulforhopalus singaporensis]SDP15317.1 Cache domain-containing protein [Desulforhopalus singaporensis]